MNPIHTPLGNKAMPRWMTRWPAPQGVTDVRALARIGSVACLLLTVGCAGTERTPQPEAPPLAVPSAPTVSVEPKAAAQAPPPALPEAKTTDRATAADTPVEPRAVPSVPASMGQGAAKAAAAPPKVQAKPPVTPSTATPPVKSEIPVAGLAKSEAAAPLDLKSLESRLKDTKAIGVFSKLTLKNQIDELLGQFRAFYQGKLKTSLADLRRSYDMLVLKVLALLQEADPPLASAIAGSREAIWGILSNPAKFAAV